VSLDTFIEVYFKRGSNFRSDLQPGQICWTPVCYSNENAEIWTPTQFDASATLATQFKVSAKHAQAYQEPRVIYSPKLEAYEEFPVIRAKVRPVVVLVVNASLINPSPDRMKLDKRLCLVAPCFSAVDPLGVPKIQESILNRIRCLEFPQFLFLPRAAAMSNDSLLRLDSVFHTYRAHLSPTQWSLSPDALDIVRGQVQYLMSGHFGGTFKAVRDTLLGK
jgi:hypothetical protein